MGYGHYNNLTKYFILQDQNMTETLVKAKGKIISILMVSIEYPPIKGGIGRYTYNLTKNLMKLGCEVYVVSNEKGHGQFGGLSPSNVHNSNLLLKIVDKLHPDIVHVQYEHGLYGLKLDSINPRNISTNIDLFYEQCNNNIPVVTTFHSTYNFRQWLSRVEVIKLAGQRSKPGIVMEYWKHLLNYYSLRAFDKKKLRQSQAGIVFSNYMAKMIGGGKLIYHGAEPVASVHDNNTTMAAAITTKQQARKILSLLPNDDRRIALAIGFRTGVKGWDILKEIEIPNPWTVVVNSNSASEYGLDDTKISLRLEENKKKKIGDDDNGDDNDKLVCLQKGFLTDEQLSLLFYAADALILPYKLSSGSGVMFDGLAHGLPFVATDLPFFKEFSSKGLGIVVKRKRAAFAKALKTLDKDYNIYLEAVNSFRKNLKWDLIAMQHVELYKRVLSSSAQNKVVG
jgi:glycosyltransferase involved in cell wall biosynthesis